MRERVAAWQAARVASPDFQAWAARFPLTRPFVRADAARLNDLVSGFVYSQVLMAAVELDLFRALQAGPLPVDLLAERAGVVPQRMETLCQAAASLGLMRRLRDGRFALGRLGAAVLGVPGLEAMIRHHALFYRDLADPVALLRGETEPELAAFWPYVRSIHGAGALPGAQAETYSELMALSQRMVAEETLDAVPLSGISHLADIGGGTGAFLGHVRARYPGLRLTLMDLPPVAEAARARVGRDIEIAGGSFLDDPLPDADAFSLIRVCYDHSDGTVARLLSRVRDALPPGGRLILSEPMSGGDRPTRSGDAYFGFYTMAMTTGRVRSADQHRAGLAAAGFVEIRQHPVRHPFVTSVLSARKPG
ncbi:MAG: methyltransferase [Pseudomonadota bacterium]